MSRVEIPPSGGETWGTYRSASQRRLMWAFLSFFALIGIAGVLQPSLPAERVTGLLWLGLIGVAVFLTVRTRVLTGPDGVTAIGWIRTHRYCWKDVERFGLSEGQGFLILKDGRQLMLAAVGGFAFRPREQERIIAALEHDRARAGHASSP